jgi:ABC-type amino acid transport substrate-binding protein
MMFGRRRVDRVGFCIAACLLLAAAVATAGPSRTLDRIRADGVIHLGYRAGAAPFSFKERDGNVRGYSVELCTRIASSLQKKLGLAALKLEWTALEADRRRRNRQSGHRMRHDDDVARAL